MSTCLLPFRNTCFSLLAELRATLASVLCFPALHVGAVFSFPSKLPFPQRLISAPTRCCVQVSWKCCERTDFLGLLPGGDPHMLTYSHCVILTSAHVQGEITCMTRSIPRRVL